MADRTGFFVVDYDDRTTCATRYLARCTHEKTTELRGYECREHAEAAARKWLSDRLGQGEVPKAVAPKLDRCESCESSVQQSIFVVNALMRAEVVDCGNYDSDRECDQAVNVMAHRSSLLAQLLRSYEDEREAIRLKRDPNYYVKAKNASE